MIESNKRVGRLSLFFFAIVLGATVFWLSQLKQNQEVSFDALTDSQFGMVLIEISDQEAAYSYHVDETGVYVLGVDEESEAYQAGIRSGDRLVSVNDKEITTLAEFNEAQKLNSDKFDMQMLFMRNQQKKLLNAKAE